jgi:hypothetical protein
VFRNWTWAYGNFSFNQFQAYAGRTFAKLKKLVGGHFVVLRMGMFGFWVRKIFSRENRNSSSSARPRLNLRKCFAQRGLCDLGVVCHLRSEPISVGKTKKAAKTEIRVRRDGSPARHDFSHTLCGHSNFLGNTILGEPHWDEKFVSQQFAWSNWF